MSPAGNHSRLRKFRCGPERIGGGRLNTSAGGAAMKRMDGIVTIVQESRFQLTDDNGVSHLFVLGHDSMAEPDQLEPLQRSQARVSVRYTGARNAIGLVAHTVSTAG